MQTNEISGQLSLAGSGSPASLKTHFGREYALLESPREGFAVVHPFSLALFWI